ncbi:MAG: hypothetical protein HDR14_13210 [Lachnospiraceae bacterium]|nr:hypothetical protein [Lachnospiraceae bacterium]
MSETITLKQFDGSTVTPKDDAIMYDSFSGETGLLEGCDLTHTGAGQIRIGAGRGIIKGRQFVVQEHTINVTLSSDSDMPGRVYIRMDLSDTSEPVKILHVTAAVLPELEQDENCNNDNGVYEIELGTYTASKLTIDNLEKTIKRISPKLAKSMVIDNPDDVAAVTEQGYPVGCRALNGLLGGIRFGVDAKGNYGYIKAGADTVTPFKRGVSFVWSVCGLSGSINLKNTGRVMLKLLNFAAVGNVNVYGATSPTRFYDGYNEHLYGSFAINSGHVNIEQVIDTPDINAYPYIIIYAVYAVGWSNSNSINTCEMTT